MTPHGVHWLVVRQPKRPRRSAKSGVTRGRRTAGAAALGDRRDGVGRVAARAIPEDGQVATRRRHMSLEIRKAGIEGLEPGDPVRDR
jgi:hypothetical protein